MFTARTPFALTVVVALSAIGLISGAAAAQAAKPGNSLNAKACQKLGWKTLVTSTGQSFTSESQCTSYAAGGGTLVPKPTGDPRCTDLGYLDLYTQTGSAFASEADCNAYAQTGQLVGLAVTQTGTSVVPGVGQVVDVATSGFGLSPGTTVTTFTTYDSGQILTYAHSDGVAGDGTYNHPSLNGCDIGGARITGFYAIATTADGNTVRSRTIVPTLCP